MMFARIPDEPLTGKPLLHTTTRSPTPVSSDSSSNISSDESSEKEHAKRLEELQDQVSNCVHSSVRRKIWDSNSSWGCAKLHKNEIQTVVKKELFIPKSKEICLKTKWSPERLFYRGGLDGHAGSSVWH